MGFPTTENQVHNFIGYLYFIHTQGPPSHMAAPYLCGGFGQSHPYENSTYQRITQSQFKDKKIVRSKGIQY